MTNIDFKIFLLSAIVPLLVGFVWYNPKVFGSIWMREAGVSPDSAKKSNMFVVFGLTYFFSILMAMQLNFAVIHQYGLLSMLNENPALKDPNSELYKTVMGLLESYGNNFRSFKHGALHGLLVSLFLVLPVVAINAMFEQKSWKYILINVGYFAVTLTLMGGIICQFATTTYFK